MTIPVPQLDDRRWAALVKEAEAYLQGKTEEWTDFSPGDPGVVLVELFAHLTELMIYRLNRVPEKAYLEYLRLLGLALRPPAAAAVALSSGRTSRRRLRFPSRAECESASTVSPAATSRRSSPPTIRRRSRLGSSPSPCARTTATSSRESSSAPARASPRRRSWSDGLRSSHRPATSSTS